MSDIEDLLVDFLRKVTEGQQPQKPKPQRPPQQGGGQQRPPRQPRTPQQQRTPPQRNPSQPPVINRPLDPDVVVAESVELEDVSTHVARHNFGDEVSRHPSQLGSGVIQEQQQLDSHVRQALGSGPRGQLVDGSQSVDSMPAQVISEVATSAMAMEIARMMRSPRELRNAIILGEIMRRPDF